MARPIKDVGAGRSAAVGLRLPPDVRKQLEAARDAARRDGKPGWTLSDEVLSRLQQSFLADATFGPGLTRSLLHLVAAMAEDARELSGHSWRRDRFTHDLTVEAIRLLLDAFAPPGRGAPPEDFPRLGADALQAGMHAVAMRSWRANPVDLHRTFAVQLVNRILDRIKTAPGTTSQEEAFYRMVAAALPAPKPLDHPRARRDHARERREITEQIRADNEARFEEAPGKGKTSKQRRRK